ncbi:MAG: putative sulfate exporter family transporter [Planctomycetota bacterium]
MTGLARSLQTPGWWAGVGLAVAVALVARELAQWIGVSLLGFDKSPISSIMVAIAVGVLLANVVRLPERITPGLSLCASTVLRLGIALLGVRLSLLGAGRMTLVALPFVVAAIAVGLAAVGGLGRAIGLSRQLSGLIAVGTSICGCSAIAATAPLIKAKQTEVSYAVACITAFGLAAMFVYPLLAHSLFAADPALAGLLLGTSIHETAQVAGAGLMYEAQYDAPEALDIATVTKLVRNLCMIAVIPIVGVLYGSDRDGADGSRRGPLVPWFILGFAGMSALRTVGDLGDQPFGFLSQELWQSTIQAVRHSAEICLLVAMAAIGLTTRLAGLVTIGVRPFLLGLFAAALVGGVSLGLISLAARPLLEALGLRVA